MTLETLTIKENDFIKETVIMCFDENDNCKFTVRKLNNNITSVQNHLGKFLKKSEYPEFIN